MSEACEGGSENIVMTYENGECEFWMEERLTMEMITGVLGELILHWNIIPSLSIQRSPDNAMEFQAPTRCKREEYFSGDQ
jgi:hypothetical protein